MIALLTDFGLSDIYVAVMKSVILGIAPGVPLVDLTHDIPAQNIAVGALQIAAIWSYLPAGAILLGVVDPGVGSSRRALAASFDGKTFVGPDNGLLSRLLQQARPQQAVALTNARYHQPSRRGETFHGRDIFAPVAGHLSLGVPLAQLGEAIELDTLIRLEATRPEVSLGASVISVPVVLIDHFGNIILDLSADTLDDWCAGVSDLTARSPDRHWSVRVARAEKYSARLDTEFLLVGNSYGLVEIARPTDSAANLLPVGLGDMIELDLRLDESGL